MSRQTEMEICGNDAETHTFIKVVASLELGEHRMILSLYTDRMDVILFNLVFGKTNIDIDTKMIANRQNWVLTMFC